MIQPDTADVTGLLGLETSEADLLPRRPVSTVHALTVAVNDRDLMAQALSSEMFRRRTGKLNDDESECLCRVA
jgi:hypothetical protein